MKAETPELDECLACGHIRYHHRPECTHRPSAFRNTPKDCDCNDFEETP